MNTAYQKLLRSAKCCSCEKPMEQSKNLNVASIQYKPEWNYPRMGNVLSNQPEKAVAILCDDCMEKKPVVIKYAIELQHMAEETIIYHPVETLQPIK